MPSNFYGFYARNLLVVFRIYTIFGFTHAVLTLNIKDSKSNFMVIKIKTKGDEEFGHKDIKKEIIRKRKMRCSYCPPNRGENASRHSAHGAKKRRLKKHTRSTVRKITIKEGSMGVNRLLKRVNRDPSDTNSFKKYIHKRREGNARFSSRSSSQKDKILAKIGNKGKIKTKDYADSPIKVRQNYTRKLDQDSPKTYGKGIENLIDTRANIARLLAKKSKVEIKRGRGRPTNAERQAKLKRLGIIKEGSGGINHLSRKYIHYVRTKQHSKAGEYANRINRKIPDGGYRAIDNLLASADAKGPKKLKQLSFKFKSVKEGSMGEKRLKRVIHSKNSSNDEKNKAFYRKLYKDIEGGERASGHFARGDGGKARVGRYNAIAKGLKTKKLLKLKVPGSQLAKYNIYGLKEGSQSRRRKLRKAAAHLKKGRSAEAKAELYKMSAKLQYEKKTRKNPIVFPFGIRSISGERTKGIVKKKRGARISIKEAFIFEKKKKRKKKKKDSNGGSSGYGWGNSNGGSGGGCGSGGGGSGGSCG